MYIKKIIILVFVSFNIFASTVLENTGALGDSNPLNAKFSHSGIYSAYFNPALMARSSKKTGMTFSIIKNNLNIFLWARTPQNDISEDIYDSQQLNPDGTTKPIEYPSQATNKLKNRRGSDSPDQFLSYLMFGFLNSYFKDRFFLGMTAVVPVGNLMQQKPFFVDQREQYFSNSLHFELYGDRFKSFSVSVGAAYFYNKFFSLGVGADISMATNANSETFISNPSVAKVDKMKASTEVQSKLVPKLSMLFDMKVATITFTIKLPSYSDIDTNNEMIFLQKKSEDGTNIERQNIKFRYYYEPLQVSLGGTWLADKFKFITGFEYEKWSDYKNRINESPLYSWYDTISMFAGISRYFSRGILGVDLAYKPSPVPKQVGKENYVDNDKLLFAMSWSENIDILDLKMQLVVNFGLQYLIINKNRKNLNVKNAVFDEFPDSVDVKNEKPVKSSSGFQTNNPGYPGFTSDGFNLNGSVSFIFDY